MHSREATSIKAPTQEYRVYFKAFGAPSCGFFWPRSWDSLGGKKYGLVIVVDYSRYTWVFFLKSKDEPEITFIDFAKQAQRKFDKEI